MILEELCGSFVALISSLVIETPPMSKESLQGEYTLIFEENPDREEVYDGLIHREYEPETPSELPYYEENLSVLAQANEQPRRNFCQTFVRSCKTNLALVVAVVLILGLLTTGIVYVDLNTTNACTAWRYNNFTLPSNIRNIHIAGNLLTLFPPFAWFPTCVMMLWCVKECKKNYALRLFICQLVIVSVTCVYKLFLFDKITTNVEYK
jgi:hypothetical protein